MKINIRTGLLFCLGLLLLIGLSFYKARARTDMYLGFVVVENFFEYSTSRDPYPVIYKYYTYGNNYFYKKTLHKLKYMGANTVSLVPLGWMNDKYAAEVFFDPGDGPKIIRAIELAHDAGLKVILKPTVMVKGPEGWSGRIFPETREHQSAWDTWFESYRKFIRFYFEAAAAADTEVFNVGVELESSLSEIDRWNDLMDDIRELARRKEYRGKFMHQILYEHNFFSRINEERDQDYIDYVNKLDYLGLSLYKDFGGDGKKGTVKYLEKELKIWLAELEDSLKTAGQRGCPDIKIIIAETGYKSTSDALVEPWKHVKKDMTVNFETQALGYQALTNVLGPSETIQGITFWNLYVDPYYGIKDFPNRSNQTNGLTSFSVNGKPAEKVAEKFFHRARGKPWVQRQRDTLFYGAYVLVVLLLSLFGIHRLSLLRQKRASGPPAPLFFADPKDPSLPKVTLQLPLYNEKFVAQRLLHKAVELEYPSDKLEIQILDDSTDETGSIVRRELETLSSPFPISYIHRDIRTDYKAGALREGLETASGELIAIFDADFLPSPRFLLGLVPCFKDPKVGLVQARWGFINAGHSFLTKAQEMFLDGHFQIEHGARYHRNLFFNFNGTAGIFRKECILDAGGWSGDSLTEDLDLSYRAQMRGWKFVYREQMEALSELPEKMFSYKSQQYRWSKGSTQTLLKLIPEIMKARLSWRVKLEALIHLANNFVYLLLLMMLLFLPSIINIRLEQFWHHAFTVDLPFFVFGICAMFVFYREAQKSLGKKGGGMLLHFPFAVALGIGLTLNNTRGILSAILERKSSFVRTPKKGFQKSKKAVLSYQHLSLSDGLILVLEAGMIIHLSQLLHTVWELGLWPSLPFIAIFLSGFLYVFTRSLLELIAKSAAGITKR